MPLVSNATHEAIAWVKLSGTTSLSEGKYTQKYSNIRRGGMGSSEEIVILRWLVSKRDVSKAGQMRHSSHKLSM